MGANLTVKNQTYRVTRNGCRFQVSADEFRHLPRLPWARSLAVLLQAKLQGWPHVGPLQPGLAWTIARLCWPISRFFLARLTTAWVTSSPARLRVYRAPALNCRWFHRAPSIKSLTVWKNLQDGVERTIRDSDTGPLTLFFPRCLSGDFPLCSALLTGLWDRCPQRKLGRIAAIKWDDEALFPTQTFNDFK